MLLYTACASTEAVARRRGIGEVSGPKRRSPYADSKLPQRVRAETGQRSVSITGHRYMAAAWRRHLVRVRVRVRVRARVRVRVWFRVSGGTSPLRRRARLLPREQRPAPPPSRSAWPPPELRRRARPRLQSDTIPVQH